MCTSMQKGAEPIYFSPCPQSWKVCTFDTPERLNFVLTPSVSPIRIHSGIMHNLQDTSWRLAWTRVALPCPWCWTNDSTPFLLTSMWHIEMTWLTLQVQPHCLHFLVKACPCTMWPCPISWCIGVVVCVCVRCKYHQPSWQKNNTKHVQGWCLTHMIPMIRSW